MLIPFSTNAFCLSVLARGFSPGTDSCFPLSLARKQIFPNSNLIRFVTGLFSHIDCELILIWFRLPYINNNYYQSKYVRGLNARLLWSILPSLLWCELPSWLSYKTMHKSSLHHGKASSSKQVPDTAKIAGQPYVLFTHASLSYSFSSPDTAILSVSTENCEHEYSMTPKIYA